MLRACLVVLVLLLAAAALGGCASPPATHPSAMEVREAQTRTFDTPDTKLVMRALLNALQDDGYVVKNAVIDLGLITATKEIDLAPGVAGSDGLPGFGWRGAPAFVKMEVRDFTGNVSEFGQQARVRVSFQVKLLDSNGHVVEVKPVEDPVFYRDFFARVDKSLYLQRERL